MELKKFLILQQMKLSDIFSKERFSYIVGNIIFQGMELSYISGKVYSDILPYLALEA